MKMIYLNKFPLITFLSFLFLFLFELDVFAWSGTIIDKETGEPIEGAVIVRSWDKTHGPPGLSIDKLEAFKEGFSDSNGRFNIIGRLPALFVGENTPIIFKPGYKFLVLHDKPRTIELTRIPTIPSLRKKELDEAIGNYIIKSGETVIFRDLIKAESDFIETSTYLIDAQSLIDSLEDGSPNRRKYVASLLAETVDVRASDSLVGVLDDKDRHVRLEAINALAKRRDPRAVVALLNVLGNP
ncbi:MAG: HEAT repeat domain-containing protein [Promethearchaeota archaeon]